jgi:hypothetical protein
MEQERFRIDNDTWAEIIYRFALASHHGTLNREHLLKSLTPLYIGRTASFVMESGDSDADDVEAKIEGLCRQYEEKKALLINFWDAQGGQHEHV